jgi:hypothetical protein
VEQAGQGGTSPQGSPHRACAAGPAELGKRDTPHLRRGGGGEEQREVVGEETGRLPSGRRALDGEQEQR